MARALAGHRQRQANARGAVPGNRRDKEKQEQTWWCRHCGHGRAAYLCSTHQIEPRTSIRLPASEAMSSIPKTLQNGTRAVGHRSHDRWLRWGGWRGTVAPGCGPCIRNCRIGWLRPARTECRQNPCRRGRGVQSHGRTLVGRHTRSWLGLLAGWWMKRGSERRL